MTQRLHLFFHGRFPSEKAASLFAAKSAEAFAKRGVEVVLVLPRRSGSLREDPFTYYGIEKNFEIVRLRTIDLFGFFGEKIATPSIFLAFAFWLNFIAFSFSCFFYAIVHSGGDDIFYSNETLPLFLVSFIRNNSFYEMHDFPESKRGIFGCFLKRMCWVLVHNRWKLEEAKRIFSDVRRDTASKKYFYEPNAVDLAAFDIQMTKEEARERLSLPPTATIAVYTGHLYAWKGVDTLAAAAQLLSPVKPLPPWSPGFGETLVIFVGGTAADLADFRRKYSRIKNIMIAGHKNHAEIPLWQKAADVLVLPNTAKEKISAYYTSPMKLFEYMASRRPIIASDIPSLHDSIDGGDVLFVVPDDPKALAAGIAALTSESGADKADALVAHAFEAVLPHTWDKRAERILRFIAL